jgi:MFS family permease
MLALIATLAIQALVSMTVLTPPVLAALAAPDIGVASERIGLFTALVYVGAIFSSAGSGALLARTGPLRLSQWCLGFCAAGMSVAALGFLPAVAVGAVLMGVGYGPVTPASSHILIRQTAPQRRSLVFSLKQTGVPLGGALAGSLRRRLARSSDGAVPRSRLPSQASAWRSRFRRCAIGSTPVTKSARPRREARSRASGWWCTRLRCGVSRSPPPPSRQPSFRWRPSW